ncbi:60S acidic ribosomal protein P0 (nucleomorph) [Guillardia theta]|uniref:60S acidic ribosomal protein P0 n=1 Tax=Guillardia theta TaxID=55529 RepID=Q98S65_GUITH|nr:60S acidic ribosomal protein P0 [Guillardia theta]AAK39716.1 60S acidic ribosomal protein P0 [Guillardia theta]|mmetsp:Transcript_2602/g.8691  ORF Transcript_2602/g.8691 Transcript_2602/m.8691 type:complete len:298 (+) Transcript_2602:2304-3197(+)
MKLNCSQSKSLVFKKFNFLFSKFSRLIVVKIENLNSEQIKKCKRLLNNTSILITGKNTLIKKVLRDRLKNSTLSNEILTKINGNVSFIFTNEDPFFIQEILKNNSLPTAAKIGQVAQSDVYLSQGLTNISPDGIGIFQSLNIPTKILKGQIEIITNFKVLEKGKKINEAEATLLQKLNILPFYNEIKIISFYENGKSYDPSVLNFNESMFDKSFKDCLSSIESLLEKICFLHEDVIKRFILNTKRNIKLIYNYTKFPLFDNQIMENNRFQNNIVLDKITEKNEEKSSSSELVLDLFN